MSARIELLVLLAVAVDCTAPAAPPAPSPVVAPPAPAPAPLPPPALAEDLAQSARIAEANTPPELLERGAAAKIWGDYAIERRLNPFYLRGDLDGDGAPDYLVSVAPKIGAGGVPRLVVLRGGGRPAVWLDDAADGGFPRDAWYVHDRGSSILPGPRGQAPELKSDGVVLLDLESRGALVYWDGARFRTYWLSD